MANVDLTKILTDTGTYQAEYKPVQNTSGGDAPKPSDCNVPAFNDTTFTLTDIVAPQIIKDCIVGFVPTPIVPTPFIDVGQLETPCAPDGFLFRSSDAGTGTIDLNITSITYLSLAMWLVQGTGTDFTTEIQDIVDAGAPYPEIEITVSSIKYTARVHSTISATQLRIKDQFRKADGTALPTTGQSHTSTYRINWIVFSTSATEPTGGALFFVKTDTIGCQGAFVGDININVASITPDCPLCDQNAAAMNPVKVTNSIYTGSPFAALAEQDFKYNIAQTTSPCGIRLDLTAPTANEIIVPHVAFADSDSVTWDDPVITDSGKVVTYTAHSSDGSGPSCCVWQ